MSFWTESLTVAQNAYQEALQGQKTAFDEGGASAEHWNQEVDRLYAQIKRIEGEITAENARAAGRGGRGPIYTAGALR